MGRKISIIAAMAKRRVIGNENHLPWHLPADLQHFKQLTLNKPIIMGRKTLESIGRVLPGRRNIVITRNPAFDFPGCEIAMNITHALEIAGDVPEVMVCGGEEIFMQAMPMADRLYLTLIDADFPGDAYFPEWDTTLWREISSESHVADEKNPYLYTFIIFDKVSS